MILFFLFFLIEQAMSGGCEEVKWSVSEVHKKKYNKRNPNFLMHDQKPNKRQKENIQGKKFKEGR